MSEPKQNPLKECPCCCVTFGEFDAAQGKYYRAWPSAKTYNVPDEKGDFKDTVYVLWWTCDRCNARWDG